MKHAMVLAAAITNTAAAFVVPTSSPQLVHTRTHHSAVCPVFMSGADSSSQTGVTCSRRDLISLSTATFIAASLPSLPVSAQICDDACKAERKAKSAGLEARPPTEDDLLLYFGAGCFWHVQHEMIVAEKYVLKRDANSFTSVAGYAGGTKVGPQGKVCYHNKKKDSDYGLMGHTEVVGVRVPVDRVVYFIEAFLDLFNKKGVRADPQDRGGEYRSAIGLPGGFEGQPQVVALLKEFAAEKGMVILPGNGDEDDTLKAKSIYVYDTLEFPFYPGELYHQYHDDMIEKYGKSYGTIRNVALERGTLRVSTCPGDS